MAIESCVTYPAHSAFLIVREPLIEICKIFVGAEEAEKLPAPDPQAAAVILHQFIFWTDGKLRNQHQSRYFANAAQGEGEVDQQDNSLWIYKDYDELKLDLLDLFGRNKIIENVQWLVLAGYLKRRTNPRYRWDKTLQYSVDVEFVQSRIDGLREFENKLSAVLNQTTEECKNKRAIPKKTTKKTEKKEKKTASVPVGTPAAPSTDWPQYIPVKYLSQSNENSARDENQAPPQRDAKNTTTAPNPVAPAPSPVAAAGPAEKPAKPARKPSRTAMIIDGMWGKSVSGGLLPMLMGNAKRKPWADYNIEGGMTEIEIFAFARSYRQQNPGLNLPEQAPKVWAAIESFRNAAEYEKWMGEAERQIHNYFPRESDIPQAVPTPDEELATPEDLAAFRQQLLNSSLGDVLGHFFKDEAK